MYNASLVMTPISLYSLYLKIVDIDCRFYNLLKYLGIIYILYSPVYSTLQTPKNTTLELPASRPPPLKQINNPSQLYQPTSLQN